MNELLTSPEHVTSFNYYSELLREANSAHPHRQGMDENEFNSAIESKNVIKTEVFKDGEHFALPQLCPIDQFEWLNTDFYRQKFPREFEDEAVLHYVDIQGIEPGQEVVSRVAELALMKGVLVFDYPTEYDPTYPDRVKLLIDRAGASIENVSILGTQTYYAGELTLKRKPVLTESPKTLIDTYVRLEQSDNPVGDIEDGASLQLLLGRDEANHLEKLYRDAFEAISDHPCKQGLDPEEFMEIVTEDAEIGKIVRSRNGQAESLCILGEKLDRFNWINPGFYAEHYPDKYKNNQVVYFPAIATDPSRRGFVNTRDIISLMAKLAESGSNGFVGAFDCCDANDGVLNKFFDRLINSCPETGISLEKVGSQTYCAISLK